MIKQPATQNPTQPVSSHRSDKSDASQRSDKSDASQRSDNFFSGLHSIFHDSSPSSRQTNNPTFAAYILERELDAEILNQGCLRC